MSDFKAKFDLRWCSAPDPAKGAYSTPLDLLVVFKGPISKRTEREKGRRGNGRGGREKGERKERSSGGKG